MQIMNNQLRKTNLLMGCRYEGKDFVIASVWGNAPGLTGLVLKRDL